MELIKELVQFTNRNKIKHIDIIGQSTMTETDAMKLYDALLAEEIEDEEEAIALLSDQSQKKKYQNAKYRLQKKLLNTIFFIDQKQEYFTAYDRAFYDCHKKWVAGFILARRGAIKLSIDIREKLFKKAEKFEFTHICMSCANDLKYQYGSLLGNVKKFEFYRQKHHQYAKIVHAENLISDHYNIFVLRYVRNKGTQKEGFEIAERAIIELDQQTVQPQTSRYIFFYNFLLVARYLATNNHPKVVAECQQALDILKNKPYVPYGFLRSFLYQQIASYTQLKEYDRGRAAVEECLNYVEKSRGDRAWFVVMKLSITLSLHTQSYQAAWQDFEEATRHRQFKKLFANQQENWLITEAYLAFLVKTGKIETTQKKYHKFRVRKFANSLPIFSKDKEGFNIPILIIQALLHITNNKLDAAFDNIERLAAYGSRYLRKDDHNFRSHCFIKMLAELPKQSFHPVAVERHTARFRKRLTEKPINISNQSYELEIIPYEDLWEMVKEELDRLQKR